MFPTHNLKCVMPIQSLLVGFLMESYVLQQYWADTARQYEFVPVARFAAAFEESPRGRALAAAARDPPVLGKACAEMDPLVRTRCDAFPFRWLSMCHAGYLSALCRRHAVHR